MENPTVILNALELAVDHVRLYVEMEGIVVNAPNLATWILEAVLTLRNGPFCQFKIQNGDVLRHPVNLLMNQLMNMKNLTGNNASWIMITVFCNTISYLMANQISDLEALK